MRKLLAPLGLSISLVAFVPAPAEACTCAPIGPPCQEVWESPLVFTGTVIELDHSAGMHSATRVRFRITEAFRGTEAGEIDIHLRGDTSGMCDPKFQLGESWLVYGHNRAQGGPGWTTSTCSRTRLVSAAAEDLEYLRLPDEQKPRSRIIGRVSNPYDPSIEKEGESVGIAGVPVIVTRGTTRLESKTDSDGRYSIAVPRGHYRVEFGSVAGLDIRGGSLVSVTHHRACAIADAAVAYDAGRLTGQIVDDRGLPVAFLPIVLMPPIRSLETRTLTDIGGRFEFPVRHPGPYAVAPSTELWRNPPPPVTPSPLTVPSGGHVDTGLLRLPPSVRVARVEIFIRDSTGEPASGARIYFRESSTRGARFFRPSPRADEEGHFSVSLIAGARYVVMVVHTRKTRTESAREGAIVEIEATGLMPVRIRLAPQRRQ